MSKGNGSLALDAPATPTDEQPVFDFDALSWGDSVRLGQFYYKLQAIIREANDDPAAAEKITDAMTEIHRLLAVVTVSVPRAWLIRGAPTQIDWADAANYPKYVQSRKAQALIVAASTAMNADDEKKD